MQKSDLIIIGGGPGGYVAAIRARQLGLSVILIEQARLGGICLNWGCIPTKALLRSAEIAHLLVRATEFGFVVAKPQLNLQAMVQRSRNIAYKLSQGIKFLMKKNQVQVVEGRGYLEKPGQVKVVNSEGKEESYTAPQVILATGASTKTLPQLEPDGRLIWTYREAMVPEELPASLLIIGSGAIGVEFASFYNALGVKVTVLEIQDRILPQEDREISALAQKAFTKHGIEFCVSSELLECKKESSSCIVRLSTPQGEQKQSFERVLIAIGIVGNIENLGLENTQAQVEKGHILTNAWGETTEPGLYAIGDVAGSPWLAHKASHEGIVCVEKIAQQAKTHPLDKTNIPACTYSLPQVASIGLTEEAAQAAGHKIKVGRFPFSANGKALALGESDGLVKTIFDGDTGKLLGAHLVGAEVTELIHGFAIAKSLESTEAELMATVFPHPTLSEMLHESVLEAFGQALHV